MSGESQIGLDFESHSSQERAIEDTWHSDNEPSPSRATSEDQRSQASKNSDESESSESSEDSPIWPRGSKRRRLSISRSKATEQVVPKKPEGQDSYKSPTKIAKIFGRDISPKDLCKLSSLKCCSPTAVLQIMPKATVKQICKIVELFENPTRSRGRRADKEKRDKN